MAEALVAEAEGLSRFDGDRRVWGPVHQGGVAALPASCTVGPSSSLVGQRAGHRMAL